MDTGELIGNGVLEALKTRYVGKFGLGPFLPQHRSRPASDIFAQDYLRPKLSLLSPCINLLQGRLLSHFLCHAYTKPSALTDKRTLGITSLSAIQCTLRPQSETVFPLRQQTKWGLHTSLLNTINMAVDQTCTRTKVLRALTVEIAV